MREKLLSSGTKKLLILSFIMVLIFGPLAGGVYAADNDPDQFWVRTDGNDGCSGQDDQSYVENPTGCAWLTIQKAADTLTAGQTVRVQSGTYDEDNIVFASPSVTVIADGTVNVDGTDTMFDLTKSGIVLDGLNITGKTSRDGNLTTYDGSDSPIPVVDISADNVVVKNGEIHQTGAGGFQNNMPERGGWTPAVRIYYADNATIYNNSVSTKNPNSYGIYLEDSTNSNIADNKIDARHSWSIMVKRVDTPSYYDHAINNNLGYQDKPIYYYYNQDSISVDYSGNEVAEIFAVYSNDITLGNIKMTNSDGIYFKDVTNSTVTNYTNIRTGDNAAGAIAGSLYAMVKVFVKPFYMYNSDNNKISNVVESLGGRHNYGFDLRGSDYNTFDNLSYTSVYAGDGTGGHNDFINMDYSSYNTFTNLNGKFGTWSDYFFYFRGGGTNNNTFENVTISASVSDNEPNIKYTSGTIWRNVHITTTSGNADAFINPPYYDSVRNGIDYVYDSSFSGGDRDALIQGTAYFTNVSVDDSKTVVTSTGTLYRRWYLDVYVDDAYGNPINQANVTAWMNDGTLAFSVLTGADGYITQQILTEYLQTSSGKFYNDYVNYTITTTKSGYDSDNIKVNLTQSKTEFVTLSSASPYDDDPDQFWVRKEGNDACSGQNDLSYAEDSTDCAWLTIQKAADTLTAGQTARVQAGHYGDETVVVTNSGTSGNRITFKADGNVTLESTYTNKAFDLNSQDYITVDGFTILKYGTGIYYQYSDYAYIYNNLIGESSVINGGNTGLGINNRKSDNTRIENNTVYNSGLYNIYVYVSDNVTMRNNVIYDNDALEQTNPDTRSDYGFRLNNMTNSYSENNTVYNIGNDYVGHAWRLRHGTYNNTFVNDKAYNFVGYGFEFDDNASKNTFIDIILDGNNPNYPAAVNSGGWSPIGVGIKLRTHDNTFTNLTVKNVYRGVDIRAAYHSSSLWGYNVCTDESTAAYIGGYCNYESRNNRIINSTFENIENSAFRMYSPGNTMEGNRIVTGATYDYYIQIGPESEILNPKDTSFTIKLDNETSALNITFTNNHIFSLDNNDPIIAKLDKTTYHVSGITNKITVTKYNSTINVTEGDLRVNSFSTSGMTIDYNNVALDYVNFTLADDVSAFDITLNNVPSGTTLTLKYANGTVIDTQTASGTVYFNDSLTEGGYYIEKEVVDTILPMITFFLPTPGDGSTLDTNYIYINVTLSEAPDWIALEWNGSNETMDGSGTNRYKNKTGLSNGTYSFKVFANDSAGNMNVSETRVVTIAYSSPSDTIPPIITIQSPQSDTYASKIISLNYTADEALDTCFVSVDGTANITLPTCQDQPVISREYESTAGTMGWYHFNENGGSSVADSSENANNGAINGALWTTGRFGSGLQFDGIDDYVAIPDDGSLNIDDSSFSIAAWIYVSSTDKGFFISKGDEGGAGSVMHLGTNYDSNDDIDFHFWGDDLHVSNAIPAYNEWFHVAFTYNAADNSRKIFVNGVQKASDIAASNISNTDGEDLIFGKDQPVDRYWGGKLDEVRMLNRTLTADEIKAEYALGAGSHNITVYASDTSGNWNSTTRYFTVLYSHTLSKGMNTVNFTGYDNTPIESSLSAVDYSVIWSWTGDTWESYSKVVAGGEFANLTSGKTYLIYANSNTTWTYPVP